LTEEAFDSEVHKTALKHENFIDPIVPLIQIKGTMYKVWGLGPAVRPVHMLKDVCRLLFQQITPALRLTPGLASPQSSIH
jgi:hypothetical protein